ncbi:MAG TPA: hypothetical protein PLT66_05300 [Bacillota bacterium]|nr:hypothetical protein [Bacillota bacterium]
MDYTVFAKDLLERKTTLEASCNSMKEELIELKSEMNGSSHVNAVPITGSGTNKAEARLINLIYRIDDTKFRLGIVQRDLKLIENGMKQLDEYESMLLEGFFIHNTRCAVDSLMSRFYKERSTIYADRRRALEKFTRAVYGLVLI